MVEKLWQCLIFYYQNGTASAGMYFIFGCGRDARWNCSAITGLNVYIIQKERKKNIHYASNKKYWKTTKTQVMELMWTHFVKMYF